MKHAIRLVTLGVAVSGLLTLAVSLSPAGQNAAQVKKVETEARALSPDVLKRLTTPTSRDAILQSIKALPLPAGPLARAAGPGTPKVKMQMRQGTGNQKGTPAAHAAPVAQNPGMSTGYDRIDWNAGVFISPFSVPRYGVANWPVAAMTTYYVEYMRTQDPAVVYQNWPIAGRSGAYLGYQMIEVALELPETAALYTVTLKVNRVDGACLESWVRGRSDGGPAPIRVYFGSGTLSPIPMAKLIDDSGFVGIVNLQPGPAQAWYGTGMRGVNAWIEVEATPAQGEGSAGLGTLVFGGLVITRLQ